MKVFGEVSEDVSAVVNEDLKRKIISNVKIQFQRIGAKGAVFEATTDFDGKYEINLPAGSYNIKTVFSTPLHKHLSVGVHRLQTIAAKDGGCLQNNFWLRNNVTISGRLLYANGEPVENAFVTIAAESGEINGDDTETEKTNKFSIN